MSDIWSATLFLRLRPSSSVQILIFFVALVLLFDPAPVLHVFLDVRGYFVWFSMEAHKAWFHQTHQW